MTENREMWTPLEAALSPFKELARLNRQTVTNAAGEEVQLVLKADRCRVREASADAASAGPKIDLGFTLGADAYAVCLLGTDYRRDGRWDFARIRADISASLRSGDLKPGTGWA